MSRAAIAGFGAVLLLAAVLWIAPWAREMRPATAAVPSPHAVDAITPVVIPVGGRACMHSVGLDSRSTRAVLLTIAQPQRRPPLVVTVTAAGYRARTSFPATAGSDVGVIASLRAPGRDLLATVCVANAGRVPVALASSADRTRSRSVAVVDGHVTDASPWIELDEPGPRRLPGRAGEILSRMATFRPGFVLPAGLAVLALLLLAGLTAGLAGAWGRACAEEEADLATGAAPDAATDRRAGW